MIEYPASSASAAFFDLDKTILATSSTLALRGDFVDRGILSRRAAIMSLLVHLPYLISGADEARMDAMAASIGDLAKGIDARLLESIVEDSLARSIDPVCYAEALAQIAHHHQEGRPVVVASASALEVVRPIAHRLGADAVLATIGEIGEDGTYTGRVLHYNQAGNKAAACAKLAAERGWNLEECWAYSDSVSDVPLLSSVGHPVAVNPDRELRRIAEEKGWEIKRFQTTTPLATPRSAPPHRALGVAAFGVLVGAGLLTYFVSRRS